MPGISPDDTFTYWLDDESTPAERRRGLVYAHRTMRDWRKFDVDRDATLSLNELNAVETGLLDLAARGLVRCVNVAGVDDIQPRELLTLAVNLRKYGWMSNLEKKDSPSPVPSDAASSAKSASPAGA